MTELESIEGFMSLRKPLDEATRQQINEAIAQYSEITNAELAGIFGDAAVEAYWSDPYADGGNNAA